MNEVDTPTAMVSPGTGSPVSWRDNRRRRGAAAIVLGLMLLLGAVVVLTMVVPVHWLGRVVPGAAMIDDNPVALKPGSAREAASRVSFDGAEVFEPEGEILFTTVSIDDDVTVFEWLRYERSDDVVFQPRELYFGDRSTSENRERNLRLMQTSKDTAVLVALAHLGVDVADATGIGFAGVVAGGPADGILEVGDIIVAIDGEPVTDFDSLRAILDERRPGQESVITVEDSETLESRDVPLTFGAHPDGLEGGFIGIESVGERLEQAPLPFDVTIESGTIGGPSAGLAFTLTILDLLTPGELTGGNDVAVTGTIDFNSSVGNVGGVAQKAAAARDEGAALFIVPEASEEAARSRAGDMAVVGVANLDEALAALSELGGSTSELALPEDSLDRGA